MNISAGKILKTIARIFLYFLGIFLLILFVLLLIIRTESAQNLIRAGSFDASTLTTDESGKCTSKNTAGNDAATVQVDGRLTYRHPTQNPEKHTTVVASHTLKLGIHLIGKLRVNTVLKRRFYLSKHWEKQYP